MATRNVLQIPELLRQILSNLDPLFLICIRSVCKALNDAITTSRKLCFYTGDGRIYGYHLSDSSQILKMVFTPIGPHILSHFWKELAPNIIRIPEKKDPKDFRIDRVRSQALADKIQTIYTRFLPVITKVRMFNPHVHTQKWTFVQSKHWHQLDISMGKFGEIFFPMSIHPLYEEYLPFRVLVDLLAFVYEYALDEKRLAQNREQSRGGETDEWALFVGFKVEAVLCNGEGETDFEECHDPNAEEEEGEEDGNKSGEGSDGGKTYVEDGSFRHEISEADLYEDDDYCNCDNCARSFYHALYPDYSEHSDSRPAHELGSGPDKRSQDEVGKVLCHKTMKHTENEKTMAPEVCRRCQIRWLSAMGP
ncbi:uncharacterized protein DFL_003475 [Arthrobotrys flagrans]|uniref:F-box domain-containing protein n=1 Tax=Arthrobotrys flagrans TaxID=97331 RepID=A0A437A1X8_ARTFL|nr:hypothetical protein DFL_003475 [Arthrobotrys flagrans]